MQTGAEQKGANAEKPPPARLLPSLHAPRRGGRLPELGGLARIPQEEKRQEEAHLTHPALETQALAFQPCLQ